MRFEVDAFFLNQSTININKHWVFYIGGMYYMRFIFNPGV